MAGAWEQLGGNMVRNVVKRDLVEQASQRCGESMARCAKVLDALLQVTRDMLVNPHEDVRIELREICIIETKASGYKGKARNPRTGEPMAVPSHRITRIRVTKTIKDAQRMIGPIKDQPIATPTLDDVEKGGDQNR
jgi:nucleoid DNA-binding protein